MSDLTDADKKSFIDKMRGVLNNPLIKPQLVAGDYDPTNRAAKLDLGHDNLTTKDGEIADQESKLTTAIGDRRTLLEETYALASSAVSSVEGALGKDHPMVIDLHQVRGGMSIASPATPVTP